MSGKYEAIPTGVPVSSDEEYARQLQAQEEATYSNSRTATYNYSAYYPPPPPPPPLSGPTVVVARPRVVYRSPPVYDPLVEVYILCCFLWVFFGFFFLIVLLSYVIWPLVVIPSSYRKTADKSLLTTFLPTFHFPQLLLRVTSLSTCQRVVCVCLLGCQVCVMYHYKRNRVQNHSF